MPMWGMAAVINQSQNIMQGISRRLIVVACGAKLVEQTAAFEQEIQIHDRNRGPGLLQIFFDLAEPSLANARDHIRRAAARVERSTARIHFLEFRQALE